MQLPSASLTMLWRIVLRVPLFLFSLDLFMQGTESAGEATVEQHLEMGKKMLAAGQLADALSHYHAAVDADPSNYMTYFRRATVLLALGRSKSALPDLDRVLDLKADFTAARLQRGNLLMKQGKLTAAHEDYASVLTKDPGNAEAAEKAGQMAPLSEAIEEARASIDNNDYQRAIDLLAPAIEECPWSAELHELRADCYEATGEYYKAIHDIRPTTKLRNDNTAGFLRLALLMYATGDAQDSLTEIRECLKLDPDHSKCFSHYKKVKKLVKQMTKTQEANDERRWEDCVSGARSMMKTEPHNTHYVSRGHGHECHCLAQQGLVEETLAACDAALQLSPNDVDVLCDKADVYLAAELWDDAVRAFQTATEAAGEGGHNRAQEGLQRAQKLLKQSQKRDYYKVLGLKRNCNSKQITKAYRKLAMQWHPDKFSEGPEKEAAQKKFIDIAAAKEVLSNPEKRAKFDAGEDPLDAEEQARANNPWQHGGGGGGFDPFGQGQGFNFKFHY